MKTKTKEENVSADLRLSTYVNEPMKSSYHQQLCVCVCVFVCEKEKWQ